MGASRSRSLYRSLRPLLFRLDPELAHALSLRLLRLVAESIRAVARDWQERQVLTPTGRMWQHTPFRRMLASPAIAGLRLYHGTLVPGTWPSIISPSDSQRVRAILDDRAGRKRGTPRRYLLTGFAFCGRCGQRLSTMTARTDVQWSWLTLLKWYCLFGKARRQDGESALRNPE